VALRKRFGNLAEEELDQVENLEHKTSQLYLALMSLTSEETNDLVIGAGAGNGAEAWRRVIKRWDPSISGRKNALLKQIISPPRCKAEELVGAWERWEEKIRKYEKRRTTSGERAQIASDILMAAFENLVPEDLENHLVLNRKRLNTYLAQKEEIQSILDSRIGSAIKEVSIKPGKNETVVSSFGTSKGKGDWDNRCNKCGQAGHWARECPLNNGGWSSSSGSSWTKG
jgi:hypothetical protein